MLHTVQAIPALKDNYIWAIIHHPSSQVIVVDPGDASVVNRFLELNQLQLAGILITHRHSDHTNGLSELALHANIPVYGPRNDLVPGYTHLLSDDDPITFESLTLQFQVLAVPGHTHGHIAYYGQEWLFSGDTLFSAGCGRMFEGTPEQLLGSLSRLAALPEVTKVYCGHEYTLNNLRFAALVEPDNSAIQMRLAEIQVLCKEQQPTLPSTIAIERQINPFLRCHLASVRQAAEHHSNKKLKSTVEVFAVIRAWKDIF